MNSYFMLDIGDNQIIMNFYPATEGGENLKLSEIADYLNRNGIHSYDLKNINEMISSVNQPVRFKISDDNVRQIEETMDLKITSDGMYAIVRFFPPSVNGRKMDRDEIMRDLQYRKVTHGIQDNTINRHLSNPEYFTNMVIAMGVPPVQGHDGKITYCFNTDRKAKPHLNKDGTVDFHHLDNIAHVKRGDVLAVITPTDRGTPGYNIAGGEVKPKKVKKVSFLQGKNQTISEDGLKLISDVDGYAILEGGRVFVSNVYDVQADVDNSTGDIEFDGSVLVRGNVRTGFKIKCAGNVEVYGVVEGAEIEAGGDIILHRGIQGMNRCRITSKGNMVSKFIESADVMVEGFVNAESILNSRVSAQGDIVVSGRGGNIIGGTVRSRTLIEATNIGTAMGVATSVEVGQDPTLKDRIEEIDLLIKNKTAEVEKLNRLVTLFRKKQAMGTLDPDKVKQIAQMTKSLILTKAEIKELQAEKEAKRVQYEDNYDAKIRVVKDIYQGTRVCVSGEMIILNDKFSHCQYTKRDGQIVLNIW